MIIVPIKEGENIEKRRNEIKKAIYVQHLRLNEE